MVHTKRFGSMDLLLELLIELLLVLLLLLLVYVFIMLLVCLRADCTMVVHASMRCQCRPTSLLSKLKFRSYEGPYYHARASNGPKRQSLRGTLGANLGKHWPTWGQLGAHLGLTWGQLGVPLGHTCGHLGPTLGPTWSNLGLTWANLGQLPFV